MRPLALAVTLAVLSAPSLALADEPREFLPRFDLDDARIAPKKLEADVFRIQVHGEYQLRGVLQSDVPLLAPVLEPGAKTLGQKATIQHWMRLTPRIQIFEFAEIIGQIDVPRGFFGDTTRWVDAARDPMTEQNPVQVDARWLYVDLWTKVGLLRVGQQPNHFGMGMVANDGDHPSLFGDYRGGDISERALFATRPLGPKSKLAVLIAGDIVYRDQYARYGDGDRAYQALGGLVFGSEHNQVSGVFAARHQTRDRTSIDQLTPFTEALDIRLVDVGGRFSSKAPGSSSWVFGEGEAAGTWGTTSLTRTLAETRTGDPEKVRAFAGALRFGVAHESDDDKVRYADVTASLAFGYATGDANPYDGTQKRFVMNPNFRVGLVLFDHVLAWKTARAATLATDPAIAGRGAPGAELLPTNGGVAGATYVNPTIVYRPMRTLDLKGGVVLATSTSDVVDPYRAGALGQIRNYDGGDPTRRDLGVELDGGVEWRYQLDTSLTLQLGAQGGVLFPGHAFDDANGKGLGTQFLTMGRVGMQL
jgi:hypothetical protein